MKHRFIQITPTGYNNIDVDRSMFGSFFRSDKYPITSLRLYGESYTNLRNCSFNVIDGKIVNDLISSIRLRNLDTIDKVSYTGEPLSNFKKLNSVSDMDSKYTEDFLNVPPEFVSSFGSYVGLNFFLSGVKNKVDIFTHVDIDVEKDKAIDALTELFGQCRYINSKNNIEYEYYNQEIGYCNLKVNKSSLTIATVECSTGYKPLSDLIESLSSDVKPESMATWVTGVDQYGDLITKKLSLKTVYEYDHLLYPFMNGENIDSFAKRYAESKSSILLLIGPPGTSKTNFIRQLLNSTSDSVLLTYSNDLKKSDSLFSHFYDSPEKYLIVEDADTYIEKRENGNTNMNQLLNITDGLTANPEKKVIFSTNLPSLSKVDPAIYRHGRCFSVLHFDKLMGEDLKLAAEKYNISIDDVPTKDGLTVANLFAIKNNEFENTDVIKKVSSFGFSGQ